MIEIDKDALKKNILKIRYNNGRKLNNKYLHDGMSISNNMKNVILKNTNINKLSKNEYHVYTLLNKYKMMIQIFEYHHICLETLQLACITLLIKIYITN